ncbi:MAG: agmatine deiminase family protein [Desulfuromonadales bacterium]|nr:agmatine deiminase family protein [Desulfuromonadales bacterium]
MTDHRLTAEWEEQDAVIMAWPHKESDWYPILQYVEPVFAKIAATISRFQKVLLIVPDACSHIGVLKSSDAVMENIITVTMETNDTWARDFGPITIFKSGKPLMLNFGFNGWGLKFPADRDNQITRKLYDKKLFKCKLETIGLILEGGSIDSDGKGIILTTSECLLNPNRNPHLSKDELEAELKSIFGAKRILWLNNGYLAGDDTDSHIDTLARFAHDNTILYVSCNDKSDEHYSQLKSMEEELKTFETEAGKPFRLIPLPLPTPKFDGNQRLPATYANFLVINNAVLVPTYSDPNDDIALAQIRTAFPKREVIGIECTPLLMQHGSLHCVTMQLLKGTLT